MEQSKLTVPEITTLFDEAFSSSPLITRKCTSAINTLSILHAQSPLTEAELSPLYAQLIRGFNSKDPYLKQILNIQIEKIGKSVNESFLAINSLAKEYYLIKDTMKPSTARALFSVLPFQMTHDYESIIFHLINNINTPSSYFLYYDLAFKKIISNTVDNNSDSLYSLALRYERRKDDVPYLIEYFSKFSSGRLGVFAVKVIFSLIGKVKGSNLTGSGVHGNIFNNFESIINNLLSLRSGDEAVFFEALNSLSFADEFFSKKFIESAISSARVLLRSKNEIHRYATLCALRRLAEKFPIYCAAANTEVELLVADSTSLRALAVAVLLRTGTDESVKRIVESIDTALFSASHKYVLFDALVKLSNKKKSVKFDFFPLFSSALKENGNNELKIFIIEKIGELIRCNREAYLGLLCDVIEDCEENVAVAILRVLSNEIGVENSSDEELDYFTPQEKLAMNDKYLFHIVNRIVMDSPYIKMVGIEALSIILNRLGIEQCEYADLIKKMTIHDDDMVRVVSSFCLENKIVEYKHFVEETISEVKLMKEYKEIKISDDECDVNVWVRKTIFNDRIEIRFKVGVLGENLIIKNGLLSVECSGVLLSSFEHNILEVKEDVFTISLNLKAEDFDKNLNGDAKKEDCCNKLIFNTTFGYAICSASDPSDYETDTLILPEFYISIIDYFLPTADDFETKFLRSTAFALDSTMEESMQRIINVLNFNISRYTDNGVVLTGARGDKKARVVVEMFYDECVNVNLDVFGTDEETVDSIINLFE